jgi:hypothetical protein
MTTPRVAVMKTLQVGVTRTIPAVAMRTPLAAATRTTPVVASTTLPVAAWIMATPTATRPATWVAIQTQVALPEIPQPAATPLRATKAKLAVELAVRAGATLLAMSRVAAKMETIRSTKMAMFPVVPARAKP